MGGGRSAQSGVIRVSGTSAVATALQVARALLEDPLEVAIDAREHVAERQEDRR
jgi:hypothetical protein